MKTIAYDGEIRINTKIDSSGISSGINKIKSAFGSIVSSLSVFSLMQKGVDLVTGSIDAALDRGDTMDQFDRTMNKLVGDSAKVDKALNNLKDTTTGTAYSLDTAAKATRNFVTRGMDLEDATQQVGIWADAVAFYGKGTNEEFSNVSDALGKMLTKGKVDMDQLDRLFDVGIDAVGMYAQAVGRSSAEVQDDLSYGRISAEDFVTTVSNAMETGAGGVQKIAGAAKEAGASWSGTISNMRTAVTRGVLGIIESLDEGLQAANLPGIKEMISGIGSTIEDVLGKASGMIPNLIQTAKGIYDEFQPVISSLGDVISGVIDTVQQRIVQDESWKKLLYSYNYYDKWYRIDYRGVNLSDLLYFHGTWIHPDLTALELTEQLLGAESKQRETHQTVSFYNQVLKRYTGEELADFLGGLSYRLAGYDTPSDWFAENFEGILWEQAPQGGASEIRYRIWDILSGLDESKKSILLPILTAPQEDMYLISMPSQLMVGSMNRYPTYLVKDGLERQRMEEIIRVYAQKMGVFYGVSSTWMENSVEVLNGFVNIQYDTRLNFPQSDAADAGDQDKDKTRDPVMKWVYEANNTISAKNGSAASANGNVVYWMVDAALGTSDYAFFTFSHETAHNQDGRYFYGGAGRRKGTGGEAHADGNIAQEMRDGCMVFNISKINDLGVEMTNNFSYQRIDSPEKIHSYYNQMFETGYVLDYLAAKAFLQLTPQQQAAVAVQATHTPGGTDSFTTQYRDVTVEEIQQMDLRDLEDLWEHQISIRNLKKGSTEQVNTATDGSYGFESFYNMNWYQSHNDNGSPDTHAFKRLGMEMLGVGGYQDGYQIYMSARSKTDLDALRQITGKDDITWKDYKLGRFQRVEENLDQVPYFDAETVIQQFREAMEQDAQNGTRSETIQVKRMLYGLVKRVTGDFSQGGIYESPQIISVTSAQQLMTLAAENPYGYYRLEEDLDFTGIAATQGSYLPHRFMGILDGNGHQITGLELPLFGDLQYAQITDLTLAQPSYQSGAQAALAVKSRQVILGNVAVEGDDSQLPLIKTKSEGYYQYTQ